MKRICRLLIGLMSALVVAGGAAQQLPPGAEAHLVAAQDAQRRQDYVAAEREYRAATVLLPRFAELHMNLGLVYQLEGRTPEAMEEMRRALAIKPGLAGANLMLGIDLCKLGEGRKAVPLLTNAIAAEPERVEAYSWLATAEEIAGDYAGELRTIQRALSLEAGNVDLRYLEGHTYETLARQEVLTINATAVNPSFSERLLGESYSTSAEWPSAVLHFENAIAATPQAPVLHVELGEVLVRAGRFDRAIRELDEELQIAPHSVRALVRRGEAELLAGSLELALSDWTRALEIDSTYTVHLLDTGATKAAAPTVDSSPSASLQVLDAYTPKLAALDSAASQLARAYVAKQHGDDGALANWATSGQNRPEHTAETCTEAGVRSALDAGRISYVAVCGPRALRVGSSRALRLLVSSALLDMGESEAALKVLERPQSASSDAAAIAYLRARCFEELASAAYLKLYQSDPNSFRLHQLLGDLAAARNDDAHAIEEYRAAIARQPSTPNLHYSLGHVLWKNSDIPAARVEFEAELANTPNHTGALHDLGQTYLMEHQPEKALSYLNQAAAAGGHGPDLDRDLGTAYAQLGDYRNAEKKYNLALDSDRDGSIHFKLARVYRALGEKEKASRESAVAADLSRRFHLRMEEDTPRRRAIDE